MGELACLHMRAVWSVSDLGGVGSCCRCRQEVMIWMGVQRREEEAVTCEHFITSKWCPLGVADGAPLRDSVKEHHLMSSNHFQHVEFLMALPMAAFSIGSSGLVYWELHFRFFRG